MEITNKQLAALRDKLPQGSQTKIAEITGFTLNSVNMVLNGRLSVNDGNREIIVEAIKIINEAKAKDEKLMEDLKNL